MVIFVEFTSVWVDVTSIRFSSNGLQGHGSLLPATVMVDCFTIVLLAGIVIVELPVVIPFA